MKLYSYTTAFLLGSLFFFIACSKDDDVTTPPPVVESKLEMLTKHVYIYDSVYSNWGLSNQTVIYARQSLSNPEDWSNERLKFYVDKTFDEIMKTGIWRKGNWSMNSDSTILNTSGSGYSNNVTIQLLSANKLVWLDNTNKTRGVQIIKK